MNTSADFLPRLDLDPNEKVPLLIRDDIQTSPIDVHIQLFDFGKEEHFYFLPKDEIKPEDQYWEKNQRVRKKAWKTTPTVKQYVEEPPRQRSRYITNRINWTHTKSRTTTKCLVHGH